LLYNAPRIDVERLSSENHIKSLPIKNTPYFFNPRACFKIKNPLTSQVAEKLVKGSQKVPPFNY
jgi:hypothetical protein